MSRSSAEMQWTRDRFIGEVSAGTPVVSQDVVTDQLSPGLNSNMLLVRSFLVVNLRQVNMQTGLGANWFSLGAVRSDPALPAAAFGPLTDSAADRSWLYRQMYRLPWLPPETFANGGVDMFGEPYQLDWQYRGGKGTNVRKDVQIRLVAEGRIFDGALAFDIQMLHLWKTDG